NPGHTLVAGLYADGRLAARTQTGVVVPTSAVDLRLQRPAVVKVQNGKAQRVDVQLGLRDATSETIEIVSGVAVGDTLLIGAAQGITTGTPVRVQAPPSDVGGGGQGAAGTPASTSSPSGGTPGSSTPGAR
ncbi:MAG TPA: hypothetical protein VGT98_03585, partial [Candidatus Elarobacter sp.]|nr:hypothetical protein [Candidatus Elarobacter sp.]